MEGAAARLVLFFFSSRLAGRFGPLARCRVFFFFTWQNVGRSRAVSSRRGTYLSLKIEPALDT